MRRTACRAALSPVSEAKMTLTPAAWVTGLGREHDPLQRENDEAEPDQDEAKAADVGLPAG